MSDRLQFSFRFTARPTGDQLLTHLLTAEGFDLAHAPIGESVQALADYLGIRAERSPINSAGLLLYNTKNPLILLRQSDKASRRRFTLAHELAHALLLRSKQRKHAAEPIQDLANADVATLERHVERIAACIILPQRQVERAVDEYHSQGIRGLRLILWLQKHFRAGVTACSRRMGELSKDYLIISSSFRCVPFKPGCSAWTGILRRAISRHTFLGIAACRPQDPPPTQRSSTSLRPD